MRFGRRFTRFLVVNPSTNLDPKNSSAFLGTPSISGYWRKFSVPQGTLPISAGSTLKLNYSVSFGNDELRTKAMSLPVSLFLSKLHVAWLKERSLSVRQEEVYENASLHKPANQTAWNDLLSDEILSKVSSTGLQIAFSHNILFDYAISILLIEDDPRRFEDFVLQDESRPLFLRPSLTYFFTRLWYKTPETFWKAFWHVFSSNQSVHLRLVARLIPTSVIANEAREIGQLTPLLDKLEQGEGVANEAMAWLLQSLRALQIRRDLLWSDFFEQVSEHPNSKFAWDLAILSSDVLERATIADNKVVINACGRIGRRLFRWIWQRRGTGENDWHNRLGASWALPLVARTYGTNVEKSRLLLEKILELTQEDNFSIDFLTSLTEHVEQNLGS